MTARSTKDLEAGIRATREELSEDIDALEDKLSRAKKVIVPAALVLAGLGWLLSRTKLMGSAALIALGAAVGTMLPHIRKRAKSAHGTKSAHGNGKAIRNGAARYSREATGGSERR